MNGPYSHLVESGEKICRYINWLIEWGKPDVGHHLEGGMYFNIICPVVEINDEVIEKLLESQARNCV